MTASKVNSLHKAHNNEIKKLRSIINEQHAKIFQLQNVLDNLPGSIYWKDKNGVYLGRNVFSMEKMQQSNLEKGKEKDSVIGKTDYDVFPKEIADAYRANDLAVIKSGTEITTEEKVILPDGSYLIQLSSKRPLRDEQDHIIGVIGNTVDITYLKKIEAELRNANEKLMRVKKDFIKNMEHDIRTPCSGIWGVSNMLWQSESDKNKKESLGLIAHAAKELLDYCNSILDFSKIEIGLLPILSKKFDIYDLLQGVKALEKVAARDKNLRFNFTVDAKIPNFLIGDSHRVQRVLINLLGNAIKFTTRGMVSFDASLVKISEQIAIVKFVIEDTGIGIPKEKQDSLYEKFSRGTPSNQGLYKGLGLGLSITKKFIEELVGEINILSELNKGTKFIVIIPFKRSILNEVAGGDDSNERV